MQIDLNGFEISSPSQPYFQPFFFSTYAPAIVSRGHDAVVVLGPGRISNFLYDVWLIGGRRHLVADLTGHSAVGVFLSGTRDSRVENNELGYGVRIHGDEGPPSFTPVGQAMRNVVAKNRVGTALYRGGVVSLSGCLTHKNTVSDNEILGMMFVANGASLNAIQRNRLHISSATASVAIKVEENYGNHIEENILDADGGVGISIEPMQNPYCPGSSQIGNNGDDNYVHANYIRNGSIGVRVSALPPPSPPTILGAYNVILGNTFIDMSVAGQQFGQGTLKNDGRLNKYLNVPVEVEDFGTGNLWP